MTRSKPPACSGCPLCAHGTDFSAIEGTGSSGVLLVGEASGEHEQRDGLPFRPYAPAGSLLERTFRRMGIDRKMFAITNAIRCRPRNNWLEGSPWEYSALAHCRKNLDAAIAGYHPRAIVALGGTALRELTGEAGEARGISHLAGYVLPLATSRVPCDGCISHESLDVPRGQRMADASCDQCHGTGYISNASTLPVIGDFHPAFLRRGKASHQGVFARIIQRAVNIAAGKDRDWLWNVVPEDRSTHGHLRYQVHPGLDEAGAFAARVQSNGDLPVSYDLETFESASLDEDAREGFTDTQIRLIQFSLADGSGIALPWEGAYREIARRVLHSGNVKCGHNIWLFDNKVLRAASEREGVDYNPRGTLHDTLQMYHHWQPDLPAHLQFAASFVSFPFPWKHLAGTDIEFYGCADVDATLRLYTFLKAKLIGDGIWGDMTVGYLGQVACVRPVLAAMEDRGVPIDDAARVALGTEFEVAQRELGVEIAGRAPVACQRVHPKEGYAGNPPEVREWFSHHGRNLNTKEEVRAYLDSATLIVQLTSERFQDAPTKSKDGTQVEDGEWYTYQRRAFRLSAALVDAYGEPTIATKSTERWCRVYDFNPNSSQQLVAYMKSKGHKVPKSKEEDAEGNAKDTTAAKELQRLAARTSDDFYLKVIEYRGLTKMRGTYVDGFKPGPDGRVHTTFTFDTGIGQLSSRNPNTQNFPKLKPTPALAKAMRAMICADPGHIITEIDFKSCHVITLGHLAGDANYTRLGRLDIHSFVAGHFLNLWDGEQLFKEPDDVLLAKFKWLKSDPERKRVRDDQAKHGILGIGNGLRAKGLYERYMESFPARACPECEGTTRVPGLRGLKKCPACGGTGRQSGLAIAEQVLAACERLFPRVFEYQEAQRKEAHERQVLRTPFGHQRRFYEVYRWDYRKSAWGHGDQAEQAVAYRLANTAHAHMREVMKELDASGMMEKYACFNQVHDSLMFHHREDTREEIVRDVFPVMMADSVVMPGLYLGVEGSQGRRWSEMRDCLVPMLAGASA